ncbi:AraC family transcriptional regulator [Pollutimonas bauzanensis]|uniref:Helix-turn-helix domain-containing protein n=1 Tax=Pollutimonas bauzanensis TaxID=658167 RepID=A0A1M5WWX5_9BURK|nr:AraC family transcriptional regulator [Pollutimonas bauzanensis]SHH92156.1 Helix-turn-helix domain-containing protein [Pollutimonas bauzanensis]
MMESLTELRVLIEQYCSDGGVAAVLPRVSLLRSDASTLPIQAVYEPMLCIVAQGRKRVFLGNGSFEYDAAKYLIVSIDLPVTGSICEASADHPYLAFSLKLDLAALAALVLDMSEPANDARPPAGLAVSALTADLLDPVVRLLRLLRQPREIAILAPLIEREILYRLLLGEQGAMLRQIALANSHLARISGAIDWIKRNYAQPFRIESVARIANMSASSFHRHFKAVTAMSPQQYQKRIRLQEARRLLLTQQADIASIGFTVGYESPSQFSREYSRLFGAPPGRDAGRLRGSPQDPQRLMEPV